jgi:hypothetical protein
MNRSQPQTQDCAPKLLRRGWPRLRDDERQSCFIPLLMYTRALISNSHLYIFDDNIVVPEHPSVSVCVVKSASILVNLTVILVSEQTAKPLKIIFSDDGLEADVIFGKDQAKLKFEAR